MRLTDFDDLPVIDAKGVSLGRVSRALFHPSEPLLVGFEVRMRPWAYVLERQRRYVPISSVSVSPKQLTLAAGTRLEKVGGRRAGVEWEQTVVWRGMPVRGASGALLGEVKEADLDADGHITRLVLGRGTTSDLAVGTREVPGEQVIGFSDGAVRLEDSVAAPEFSGGIAAGAGRTAAVAKVTAERAAKGAVTAAASAARAAKGSSIGKRAALSWKGFAEGVKEGLADDGDGED